MSRYFEIDNIKATYTNLDGYEFGDSHVHGVRTYMMKHAPSYFYIDSEHGNHGSLILNTVFPSK